MDKCGKKDCVDFDVPIEDVEFGLDSCNECYSNRQNANWPNSGDNFVKVDRIVNPTADVPAIQDQGGAIVEDGQCTFTPIPTMKDMRSVRDIFIEEDGPISEANWADVPPWVPTPTMPKPLDVGVPPYGSQSGSIINPLSVGIAPIGITPAQISAAELQMDANKMTTFADVLDEPDKDIKDSGGRTEFDTGAVRDAQGGKGRFDLLPKMTMWALAQHYEKGCQKYGDRNWEKGIPIKNYVDSGERHLTEFQLGLPDENHLIAAIWNLCCAYETLLRIDMGVLPKSLDNIPYPLRGTIDSSEMVMPWERMRHIKLEGNKKEEE